MKKLSVVFVISIMLLSFGFARNTIAQQNITPPLLMQQNQASAVPAPVPGTPPTPPGSPLILPGTPPTPPGPAGAPTVLTIPTQKLLANLQQATATAERLNKLLTPGKVWIMRAPAGEIQIKGGLLYQGIAVALLYFNPVDGSVLPLGISPHTYPSNIQIKSIKSNLSSAIGNLKILPAAEFMEPEACWSFPVAIGNTIVAHIKVYYDGIHVVQDYMANQEMTFYGQ
jgi:hypothetical protein